MIMVAVKHYDCENDYIQWVVDCVGFGLYSTKSVMIQYQRRNKTYNNTHSFPDIVCLQITIF